MEKFASALSIMVFMYLLEKRNKTKYFIFAIISLIVCSVFVLFEI